MKRKDQDTRQVSLWTMAAAAMAVLLFLNFLAFAVLCLAGVEMVLEPAAGIVAAIFILLGFAAALPAKRKGAAKLWRRLLAAGIACNFLIVAFYCGAAVLLLAYLS